MLETEQIQTSFPTAFCRTCDRDVLTCVDFDSPTGSRRCVHCDSVVGNDLRWISAPQLEAQGYRFGEPPIRAGGCGSGGCGTCTRHKL